MIEAVSGFADQALDSARAFRLMLDAMARPGRILPMPPVIDAPSPLLPSAATICLALCDYDTPLWLDETLRTPAVLDYVRFHSGAPVVTDIATASFLLCGPASAAATLAAAHRGTAEYPDASATLVIQLDSLAAGDRLTLSGPGIDGSREFSTLDLSSRFWDLMADNHAGFPLGSDVFFAASGEIAALPRSTHTKREGAG
ncbi:MAG: phosphonate C-P lyase system protein PhnH [Parvibaculaceae bacterium]